MYNCKKVVVVGVPALNLFHRWQIQVLMGCVTPIACFKEVGAVPDLPEEVGILFLTDRKPSVGEAARFARVFHAPLRPTSAPALGLSTLLTGAGGGRYWQRLHAVCLPTRRLSAAGVHALQPRQNAA